MIWICVIVNIFCEEMLFGISIQIGKTIYTYETKMLRNWKKVGSQVRATYVRKHAELFSLRFLVKRRTREGVLKTTRNSGCKKAAISSWRVAKIKGDAGDSRFLTALGDAFWLKEQTVTGMLPATWSKNHLTKKIKNIPWKTKTGKGKKSWG